MNKLNQIQKKTKRNLFLKNCNSAENFRNFTNAEIPQPWEQVINDQTNLDY